MYKILLFLLIFMSGTLFAQFVIKRSPDGTHLMTVDESGNAMVLSTVTSPQLNAQGLKLSTSQAATGKVLVSGDSDGNAEWQDIPVSQDNQTLGIGAGTDYTSVITLERGNNVTLVAGNRVSLNENVTARTITLAVMDVNDNDSDPGNELQNLAQVLTTGNNANGLQAVNFDRIGINSAAPNSRLESNGVGPSISIEGITGNQYSHRFGMYSLIEETGITSYGNFAIMGSSKSPASSTAGYFNAGVAGRVYTASTDLLAQGELGKSQTTGAGRWVSSVMGNLHADKAAAFVSTDGYAAAIRANVIDNTEEHARVWAGYFDGAKYFFSHTDTMQVADYAEWFEKEEDTVPGDVIGINPMTGKARKYRAGDELVGVHSENPAITGNYIEENMEAHSVVVALLGQIRINSDQIDIDRRIVKTRDGQKIGMLLSNDKVLLKIVN